MGLLCSNGWRPGRRNEAANPSLRATMRYLPWNQSTTFRATGKARVGVTGEDVRCVFGACSGCHGRRVLCQVTQRETPRWLLPVIGLTIFHPL